MAKLIFRSGMYAGKNMSLPEGKALVMGRNRDVDLPLNDPKLSRRHCQLTATGSGCILVDLASTNGTFVNGNRLEANRPQELIEFDRIVLGDTEIELYLTDAVEKTLAVSSDDNIPIVRVPENNASVPPGSSQTAIQAIIDGARPVSRGDHGSEIQLDPDPLLAALYEMGLPLPPEPPATALNSAKSDAVYCGYCGAKISEADRAPGAAGKIVDKHVCKACLAKPGKTPGTGVSAMLAGLEQEPTVVDTSKKPRLAVFERDTEADRKQQNPQLKTAPTKPSVFGDDFEEIG